MLERLRIQNFKSWQDTGDMAFGSLTGFFGTNSSGKSSILQFLLMLKQTVESSDRSRVLHLGDDKSYVDLGTTYDILHNHDDPGLLQFDFTWKAPAFFTNNHKNDFWESDSFYFSTEIVRTGDIVDLIGFWYEYQNKTTGIKMAAQSSGHGNYIDYNLFHIFNKSKITGAYTSPLKFYSAPNFITLKINDRDENYADGILSTRW